VNTTVKKELESWGVIFESNKVIIPGLEEHILEKIKSEHLVHKIEEREIPSVASQVLEKLQRKGIFSGQDKRHDVSNSDKLAVDNSLGIAKHTIDELGFQGDQPEVDRDKDYNNCISQLVNCIITILKSNDVPFNSDNVILISEIKESVKQKLISNDVVVKPDKLIISGLKNLINDRFKSMFVTDGLDKSAMSNIVIDVIKKLELKGIFSDEEKKYDKSNEILAGHHTMIRSEEHIDRNLRDNQTHTNHFLEGQNHSIVDIQGGENVEHGFQGDQPRADVIKDINASIVALTEELISKLKSKGVIKESEKLPMPVLKNHILEELKSYCCFPDLRQLTKSEMVDKIIEQCMLKGIVQSRDNEQINPLPLELTDSRSTNLGVNTSKLSENRNQDRNLIGNNPSVKKTEALENRAGLYGPKANDHATLETSLASSPIDLSKVQENTHFYAGKRQKNYKHENIAYGTDNPIVKRAPVNFNQQYTVADGTQPLNFEYVKVKPRNTSQRKNFVDADGKLQTKNFQNHITLTFTVCRSKI
jgi:hypothetical protein